jgi:RND family efflux transporter MFP subunit
MSHTKDPAALERTARPDRARREVFLGLPALLLLATLGDGGHAGAADLTDPSADVLILRRCPIDYERSATMGSPQHGVIQDCLVAPGDRVKAGQVLARLHADDIRAEVKLREMEAESDVDIRLNRAKSAQATIKLKTTQALVRRNAASVEEFNLQKAEAEAAILAIEMAEQGHRLAKVRLQQAQAQLRAREFVSPHDGVVVAILKRRGEPVAPNEPIFKVVDPTRLQLTGRVDVTDSWRLRLGQSVRVIPEIAGADLPVEREAFTGRIVFIDTHIDPMTQTCKVLVNFDNRGGLLRAGLEARIEIDPRAVPDDKTPAAGPPPGGPPRPATGAPAARTGGGTP